jgi:hypothetical protein
MLPATASSLVCHPEERGICGDCSGKAGAEKETGAFGFEGKIPYRGQTVFHQHPQIPPYGRNDKQRGEMRAGWLIGRELESARKALTVNAPLLTPDASRLTIPPIRIKSQMTTFSNIYTVTYLPKKFPSM